MGMEIKLTKNKPANILRLEFNLMASDIAWQ